MLSSLPRFGKSALGITMDESAGSCGKGIGGRKIQNKK
jgi:hypothetical protein